MKFSEISAAGNTDKIKLKLTGIISGKNNNNDTKMFIYDSKDGWFANTVNCVQRGIYQKEEHFQSYTECNVLKIVPC